MPWSIRGIFLSTTMGGRLNMDGGGEQSLDLFEPQLVPQIVRGRR